MSSIYGEVSCLYDQIWRHSDRMWTLIHYLLHLYNSTVNIRCQIERDFMEVCEWEVIYKIVWWYEKRKKFWLKNKMIMSPEKLEYTRMRVLKNTKTESSSISCTDHLLPIDQIRTRLCKQWVHKQKTVSKVTGAQG